MSWYERLGFYPHELPIYFLTPYIATKYTRQEEIHGQGTQTYLGCSHKDKDEFSHKCLKISIVKYGTFLKNRKGSINYKDGQKVN